MQEQTKELTKMFIYQGKRCLGRLCQFNKSTWTESNKLHEVEIEFFKEDFEDLRSINLFGGFCVDVEEFYTRELISKTEFESKAFLVTYSSDTIKIKFTSN